MFYTNDAATSGGAFKKELATERVVELTLTDCEVNNNTAANAAAIPSLTTHQNIDPNIPSRRS